MVKDFANFSGCHKFQLVVMGVSVLNLSFLEQWTILVEIMEAESLFLFYDRFTKND